MNSHPRFEWKSPIFDLFLCLFKEYYVEFEGGFVEIPFSRYHVCTWIPKTSDHHITLATSHTSTLSSQPQLAHHPSVPNRHQSTPMANSVCRPIRPSSLPPPTPIPPWPPPSTPPPWMISALPSPVPGAAPLLPSVHSRHVMS